MLVSTVLQRLFLLVHTIIFVLVAHHVSSSKDGSAALETKSSTLLSQFLLLAVYFTAVPLQTLWIPRLMH